MLDRVKLLIDDNKIDKFRNANVLIVGLGGVGGACFEALVRMGINNLTVVDGDVFDVSNLNRQLLSTRDNIGHSKAKEAYLRGISINPDILIDYREMFLDSSNIDELDFTKYDYVVDCCDTVSTKLLLIEKCIKNKIKIISSMGTGNRFDPTKLIITDIWKTNYDPLAKVMRKLLREKGIKDKIMVLTSTEQPVKITSRTPGSTAFVPNSAGFCIASYIFNDIINIGSDNYGTRTK